VIVVVLIVGGEVVVDAVAAAVVADVAVAQGQKMRCSKLDSV